MALLTNILLPPTALAVGLGVLTILVARKSVPGWSMALGLLAVVGSVLRSVLLVWQRGEIGFDFSLFWKVGSVLWEGRDPYLLDLKPPFLYPPNAPPIMALLAILPEWTSDRVFAVLNILIALALAPLSALAFRENHGRDGLGLSAWEILTLASAVVLSPATSLCVGLGQLPVLVAGFLLAALAAQSRGLPVLAGLGLGVAALKPTTTIPFLVLFLRRADVRAWAALVILTLGLCLMTGRPAEWPAQLQAVLKTIRQSSEPGGPNDYSFANTENAQTRMGLDHTLYRLGLRNHRLIGVLATAMVAALGAWLFWEVVFRRALPRGAALSLVALYSMLFFYHRTYDSVMLTLPMVYAANQTRLCPRSARPWYGVVVLSCLAVLYTPRRLLEWGLPRSMEWGGLRGWAFQAVVTPWATWWVMTGLASLVLAQRRCEQAGPKGPATVSVLS